MKLRKTYKQSKPQRGRGGRTSPGITLKIPRSRA